MKLTLSRQVITLTFILFTYIAAEIPAQADDFQDVFPIFVTEKQQLTKPVIVTDGEGGIIIAWFKRGLTPDGSDSSIYSQRINSNGEALWGPNGIPISTTLVSFNSFPEIISDDSGGAIIAWRNILDQKVYAQRINAQGIVQWTNNGVAIGITGPFDSFLMTSDANHGAIFAWEEGDAYFETQRIDAGGNIQWQT